MNYYLAKYEGFFVIAAIPVSVALIVALTFLIGGLLHIISKLIKPGSNWTSIILIIAIISSILIVFSSVFKIFDDAFYGKVKLCYITEIDGDKRLTVWTRREQAGNMLTLHTHRFISYDIKTGREYGVIKPAEHISWDDFSWYGPFGVYAWGYTAERNSRLLDRSKLTHGLFSSEKPKLLMLMDLYTPEIIYGTEDILNKNPELKPTIRLAPYKNVYTTKYMDIAVSTSNGDIYWINPDLNVFKASEIEDIGPPVFKKIGRSTRLQEWKERKQSGDKKWIDHPAPGGKNAGCVLMYEDSSGNELNRIDLCAMFYPETRPCALLEYENEILIFVSREGYSLTAIRTDFETGKIKGQVNYFK